MNQAIIRNRYYFLLDVLIFFITPTLALLFRIDSLSFNQYFFYGLVIYTTLGIVLKTLVFYYFGIYRRFWRFASLDDVLLLVWVVFFGTFLLTSLVWLRNIFFPSSWFSLPRSLPILDGILTFLCIGFIRMAERIFRIRQNPIKKNLPERPTLIVGANEYSTRIAREMLLSETIRLHPLGFLDEDINKKGLNLSGIPVFGEIQELSKVIHALNIQVVVIALPTSAGNIIREVVQTCESHQVEVRILPELSEMLGTTASVRRLREVRIEDLLRREAVETDINTIRNLVTGKKVLVTGAGGSIGQEICFQLLACSPEKLIALGHGEGSIFDLLSKIKDRVSSNNLINTHIIPVIADIRDSERMHAVFASYQPDIIFHAAAHKHVPLMEQNICDAITNNILGTQILLKLAEQYQLPHFVFISSDKAVNPTSIMGATKRVGEILVKAAAMRTGAQWVCVRFGNVLGSRGSVVPFFQRQIADGGPVTVTHPDIERFFMTIPEAVQLVLQAFGLGQSGTTYILDMGKPIKIADLARDMIRLSGLQPDLDIKIEFVGMRPGEKMYEEVIYDGEKAEQTPHPKIKAVYNPPYGQIGLESAVQISQLVNELILLAHSGNDAQARKQLSQIIHLDHDFSQSKSLSYAEKLTQ
ncbi:MAG TPA: nucleoside-diphosphate sugar epimerase/dehydratase [Anaerolineales bacterium]|nr:nucleoside-diphosphate sugar epimerase/dehydratase [Anaerolineales bacterium]